MTAHNPVTAHSPGLITAPVASSKIVATPTSVRPFRDVGSTSQTGGAGATNALTELLDDPIINLGFPYEAIRDDLRAKLAAYNASRERRGLLPIDGRTGLPVVKHLGREGCGL